MSKIFFLDDELENCHITERFFVSEGHEFKYETDPRNFLAVYENENPDLVMIDTNLGGDIDGVQVLSQLRNNNYNGAKIIMLAGFFKAEDHRTESIRLGADDFIVKPIEPNILAQKVGALLK
ncbi:MAG: response regulator [Candidatus Omnitrophota bacterium]